MRSDEAKIVANVSDGHSSWSELGVYSGKSIGRQIEDNLEHIGDCEIVFTSAGDSVSHKVSALVARSKEVAAALIGLGLNPGDRAAVMMPNGENCLLLWLAGMHCGVTIVPIVMIYGISEVEFILKDSGARAFFCLGRTSKKDSTPIAEHCIAHHLVDHVVMDAEDVVRGALSWNEFLNYSSNKRRVREVVGDDLSFIVYTSGTTSRPKGVRHTHNTLGYELASSAWDRTGYARGLAAMPAGHIAGLLIIMRPFFWPGSIHIMDEWDAERAARLIESAQISESGGTPYHFNQLIDMVERLGSDIRSLKMWISGATVVPESLVRRGNEYGIAVCRCYGSSEHPTISQNFPHNPEDKRIGTDGQIMPHVRVRIVDDSGNDLPALSDGHILSRGPDLFVGYTDEALNRECFLDGWYRTGDIGKIDAENYLTITGREKDIIIRGGENISAREVEETLLLHPAVKDAAAVAMPDPAMGEKVCAFIVLRHGESLSLEETLRHFISVGLAKQKTPERLFFVESLPRNGIGKADKKALKAQLQKDLAAP
ncbi:AMP-dependent synthetase and ligase [Hyphomonas polymorpha PS728]|uniref:3-methylmercaptopropionyl-CoA ligase n=1 Tax=Hyphomonas polymorpha PS728 TaxID=1280954 RepID=A0A062VB83_9PROT|nr:AMP-binding protein [Hyphomonas polymorpha]KCZ96586.1 AMP-dependent synthetase and ligase [Hyphomonas polymorpha PS728]